MKSIERAHIVVVAGGERGEALAAQLRRMQVRQVTTVRDVEEARRLCAQGDTSLCLVDLRRHRARCGPAGDIYCAWPGQRHAVIDAD